MRRQPEVKARRTSAEDVRCTQSTLHDGGAAPATGLGRQTADSSRPGLEPKTVVNAHRILHRAWEDFGSWKLGHRNVVKEAHAPAVPRKGRRSGPSPSSGRSSTWPAGIGSTRCGYWRQPRVCAAASWPGHIATGSTWRPERSTIGATRVVVDGRVIESDGKTENAQRIAGARPVHPRRAQCPCATLDEERDEFGSDYEDHGLLFCWENGRPPHPDTITRRFKRLAQVGGSSRHRPARRAAQLRDSWPGGEDRLEGTQRADRPRRRGIHDEAVRADRPGGGPPGRNMLAELIVGGSLVSIDITEQTGSGRGRGGVTTRPVITNPFTKPFAGRKKKARSSASEPACLPGSGGGI